MLTDEDGVTALTPVRVAVVGLGYWGPNLVRNLRELEQAELVAVCDKDARALESLARRYPDIRSETSYEAILDDDSIEAVVIATSVGTHYSLALRALDTGKHVFVEKPLACSRADAVDLVRAASDLGLTLMPGHTFLYSPSVNLIRSHIRLGTIGTPYFISMSRVNLGLHQNDVSVLWDLGPHDFSILRFWLDENPVAASAIGRSCIIPGREDVAFVNLEYASGTIAHVELSWLAPSKLRRTTIVGSERMIVYDDTSPEPVRLFDSGVSFRDPQSFGEFQLSYRMGDIVSPHVESAEPLLLEMEDFCESVRRSRRPKSDWQIGVDVVQVIEAVERSLEGCGERVPVEVVPAQV